MKDKQQFLSLSRPFFLGMLHFIFPLLISCFLVVLRKEKALQEGGKQLNYAKITSVKASFLRRKSAFTRSCGAMQAILPLVAFRAIGKLASRPFFLSWTLLCGALNYRVWLWDPFVLPHLGRK